MGPLGATLKRIPRVTGEDTRPGSSIFGEQHALQARVVAASARVAASGYSVRATELQ